MLAALSLRNSKGTLSNTISTQGKCDGKMRFFHGYQVMRRTACQYCKAMLILLFLLSHNKYLQGVDLCIPHFMDLHALHGCVNEWQLSSWIFAFAGYFAGLITTRVQSFM